MSRSIVAVALALVACKSTTTTARHDARATGDAALADSSRGGPVLVYVGAGDSQIHAFVLDPTTLALAPAGTTATGTGPSFLAFDPKARWLVAVNEGADAIESFAITPATGALARIDGASSHGAGPAHIGVDATGAWVTVADYTGGTAAVIPIAAGGMFGAATATISPGANAHEVVLDAANAVAYVPCLGADRVAIYAFDAAHGTLVAQSPVTTATGAGPRHLALAGAHAWVIAETTSTITTYTVGAGGALTARGTVSSRAAGATGVNTGAEIAVHPSGKWVYASNRGDDTIGVFAVGTDGALVAQAHVPSGGAKPRHFSLALDGRALLVANQTGNTIVGFHVDPQTGALTSAGKLADISAPQFVGALRLP